MKIRRSHHEHHRISRPFAVLAVVAMSLICIAVDRSDRTLDWSLVTSAGIVCVLALHSRLSRRRPALRLLVNSTPGRPPESTRVTGQATG